MPLLKDKTYWPIIRTGTSFQELFLGIIQNKARKWIPLLLPCFLSPSCALDTGRRDLGCGMPQAPPGKAKLGLTAPLCSLLLSFIYFFFPCFLFSVTWNLIGLGGEQVKG